MNHITSLQKLFVTDQGMLKNATFLLSIALKCRQLRFYSDARGVISDFSIGGPESVSVRYRSNGSLGSCPMTLIHRVTALYCRAFI